MFVGFCFQFLFQLVLFVIEQCQCLPVLLCALVAKFILVSRFLTLSVTRVISLVFSSRLLTLSPNLLMFWTSVCRVSTTFRLLFIVILCSSSFFNLSLCWRRLGCNWCLSEDWHSRGHAVIHRISCTRIFQTFIFTWFIWKKTQYRSKRYFQIYGMKKAEKW